MPRGRFISKSITTDKRINDLSDDLSRLAFTWLITLADCEGRTFGDPILLRNTLFPRRTDITIDQMETYIQEWSDMGLIVWYEAEGDQWIQFPNFEKHQTGLRKDREAPSDIPSPNGTVQLLSSSGVTPDEIPVKVKLSLSKVKDIASSDATPDKSEKKKNPHDIIRKALDEEFQRLTNLQPPSNQKEAGKLWYTPIREMCQIANWNQHHAIDILRKTFHHHATERGLDYNSPLSFMKSYRMIAAQQKPIGQVKQEDYSTLTQEQADSLIANYERQGVELSQKEKDDIYARVE